MMSEERADAQFLRRKDDEHVSMFKARAGMGGVIMEGQEISAVVRYIEALEARVAAPVVPPGYRLVPIEPTQAMMDAWNNSGADDFKIPNHVYSEFTLEEWEQWVRDNARKDWAAMIAAAPTEKK